jgi:hypothetical protein
MDNSASYIQLSVKPLFCFVFLLATKTEAAKNTIISAYVNIISCSKLNIITQAHRNTRITSFHHLNITGYNNNNNNNNRHHHHHNIYNTSFCSSNKLSYNTERSTTLFDINTQIRIYTQNTHSKQRMKVSVGYINSNKI